MSTLAIIPARYASTRYPGKPLVDIAGKSMIQRVYDQVSRAILVDRVIVATDDSRIFDHVKSFGGDVMMTSENHVSGTDRCAEVARAFPDFEVVINVQGDEPFLSPDDVDRVVEPLTNDSGLSISTLSTPVKTTQTLFDPNAVKVVRKQSGEALYFSRQAIPFMRNVPQSDWLTHQQYLKHLGIYGFRSQTLMMLSSLKPSSLEKAESLEQLRWLEAGFSIFVGITENDSIGIDTPEDLQRLMKRQLLFDKE
ncbi:MAG: 3-deoxy-manno-octulosonate cytidylyltransferase [Saprospiraceae bacterium]|nr:3-deoxy-manno-octulosonate cytidylyltransferase [Saprospiraceae bacterium]MCB9322826.1 3-deoxy-manno-octulosonate cytidylyltransferase [Lewinellaceae bacterium]